MTSAGEGPQLSLETAPEGVFLPVHAQPGARKNSIIGIHAGRLKVAVTIAPEKGKANQALIEVLAKDLGLTKSQIELLSGHTNSQKRFLVRGVTLPELQTLIFSRISGGMGP